MLLTGFCLSSQQAARMTSSGKVMSSPLQEQIHHPVPSSGLSAFYRQVTMAFRLIFLGKCATHVDEATYETA